MGVAAGVGSGDGVIVGWGVGDGVGNGVGETVGWGAAVATPLSQTFFLSRFDAGIGLAFGDLGCANLLTGSTGLYSAKYRG